MFQFRFHPILLLSLLVCFSCKSDAAARPSEKSPQSSVIDSNRIKTGYFDLPMQIAPTLSGNFGEIRVNHLHSGLDFKTQQRIGIPIHAPADGWVSRVRTGPYSFGLALYLDHENGFTTVYGHLNAFSTSIASKVLAMQYQLESFDLDTLLPKNAIAVKKGEIVAYSGNSGSSAAPHLHFEIRDTKTEETIDPLLWFSDRFKDNTSPRFQKIALFALEGEGVLSNKQNKYIVSTSKNKAGKWILNGSLPIAWGKIGFGLNAYDFMDETSNFYGVRSIKLFKDETLIFEQDLSRFNFDQTRFVNSLIDYESWQRNKTWIMKSFLDPGNFLKVYPTLKDRGIITIDSAKTYNFRYELLDRAGNRSELQFSLKGVKNPIIPKKNTGQKMEYWVPNEYNNTDFKITIPAGSLYKTLYFNFEQQKSSGISDTYIVGDRMVPLQLAANVQFRIQRDTFSNKAQYYLAKINAQGTKAPITAHYRNGWMEANIKEFGSYRIERDTISPKITPSNIENIAKNSLIRIRISDNASGIQSWRGTIDGKWVLFALDGKTGWLTCNLLTTGLNKNQKHTLHLSVTDACGNERQFLKDFKW